MNCHFKNAASGVFLVFICSGCGPYSFSSSGATHIKTVAIPIFQDQTSEFGVKERLTENVINEFTRDNTLRVSERRNADSLIEGIILTVNDEVGAFSGDESVQDIKVYMTVKITFRDLVKRKIVWEKTISHWGTFNPDEGPQSRESGIEEAAQKIASEILDNSVSGW